ncbi:uncharacterized protein LOC122232923 isoform X6 [Panthera tigris]|uniref:uncharacterized protein LOC122232923 isoform X6 n=1 Tax=Panthera tigris TaxID=9694 RepID=UPI001C6F6057|nr:uncharacterized protein LOC122232923 isoform X6 [Panthera tigris]
MRRPPRRATRAHLAAARRLPGYGHSRLGVPVLPAKFVSVRARRSESCARLPRAEPREGPQAPFEAPCLLGPLLARPPAAATPPRGSRAVRSCSSSCPALPPWRPGSLGARSGPRHRVDGDQDSVLCSAAVERAFALERLPQAASVRPGCPASPLLRPEDGTIRALPRWILGMRGAAVCILIFPVRIERFASLTSLTITSSATWSPGGGAPTQLGGQKEMLLMLIPEQQAPRGWIHMPPPP